MQYHSRVQGLSGKTWMSPVSDEQAAALLRQDPNFTQASLQDSDEATAQTVRVMTQLVNHSLSDPIIKEACKDAWKRFAGISGGDFAQCAWWYAKYTVKFVHHQELLGQWLMSFDDLQLLISPEALLKMQTPKGDCAIFTTLIQAMLATWGIGYETVTVAVNPRMPELYTHVYAQAIRDDGTRIVLDASHGLYPGWEVPAARILKKKSGTQTGVKSPASTEVN